MSPHQEIHCTHLSQPPRGPLARSIVTLAGTPDDASDIDTHLATIARLAASTLPPVSYASVTAVRDSAYITVAASSELAVAVDQAQYAEGSGPCLDALHDGAPVGVDDESGRPCSPTPPVCYRASWQLPGPDFHGT